MPSLETTAQTSPCPKILSLCDPDGESVPGLIKFDVCEDGDGARSEHIFAHMARAAGIHAVETRLLEEAPGTARWHLFRSSTAGAEASSQGRAAASLLSVTKPGESHPAHCARDSRKAAVFRAASGCERGPVAR